MSYLREIEYAYSKKIYLELLKILLIDRTTGRNIIWGTEDYEYLGSSYHSHYEISVELISGVNHNIIQPRIFKTKDRRGNRTKGKAEVFTPAWLCNKQNNLIDEAWFGRQNVFNKSLDNKWITNEEKIGFSDNKDKSWQNYVDERRLEVACGEAPYLVSRYDSVTGRHIKLNERIGLLDRKMRIVSENTLTEAEWLKWTERAYQSIYGFEFQGDNLFLARENMLLSYVEYTESKLRRIPSEKELLNIAKIISWNIWQMDGLTNTIPYQVAKEQYEQISIFGMSQEKASFSYCTIKDWRSKKITEFRKLMESGDKS